MPSTRSIVLPLAALLLAPAVLAPAVGTAAASPAPIQVCPACGESFENAAGSHDVDLSVEHSTATVRVHDNGSATWTVRNYLASRAGADRLAENASLLAAIARDTLDGRGHGRFGHVYLGSSVTANGTVVVRFRTPSFASRLFGVLLVDYFRQRPGSYMFIGLGASRLTVVGPPGTTVTNGLPGAETDGRRLVLTAYAPEGAGSFVAFGGADDPTAGARTGLAIAVAAAANVVQNALVLLLFPVALLWGLVASVSRSVRDVASSASVRRTRRLAAGLAVAGVVAAIHPLYAPVPLVTHYVPPLAAGGVGVAVVGIVVAADPTGADLRRQVGAVVAGLAAGAVAVVAVAPELFAEAAAVGAPEPTSMLTPAPVLLALPAGWAAARASDEQARRRALAVPALALALGVLWQVPLTATRDLMLLLDEFRVFRYAFGVGLLGAPLLALGTALAAGADDRDDAD